MKNPLAICLLLLGCVNHKTDQAQNVIPTICEIALRNYFQIEGLEEIPIGIKIKGIDKRVLLDDMGKFPANILSSVVVKDTVFLRLVLGYEYSVVHNDTTYRYVKNFMYYKKHGFLDDVLIVANIRTGEIYYSSSFNEAYPFVRLLLDDRFITIKASWQAHPFDTTFFDRAVQRYGIIQILNADSLLGLTAYNLDTCFTNYSIQDGQFLKSFSLDWYGYRPNPVILRNDAIE
jgi:hypothetical protein